MTNLKEGDKILCIANKNSNTTLIIGKIYIFHRYTMYGNNSYLYTKENTAWHAHISNFKKLPNLTPKGNKRI